MCLPIQKMWLRFLSIDLVMCVLRSLKHIVKSDADQKVQLGLGSIDMQHREIIGVTEQQLRLGICEIQHHAYIEWLWCDVTPRLM